MSEGSGGAGDEGRTNGAFTGIRVVDLSDRLSGAFAARLLGDHGADVVLVEPPEGHALRHEPPFLDDVTGVERSVLHAYANWNKRSVVEGPDLGALLESADVVVTTGRHDGVPGRPDLVHLMVTPHGLDGPLASLPGNNLTHAARTGWAALNGLADEPPLQLPTDVLGYVAGFAGFVATAGALLGRRRSGRGRSIDLSELEVAAVTCAPWATSAAWRGRDTAHGPLGARRRGAAGPLFEARNGRICLGFGDWKQWPSAMELLGLPELGADPLLVPDFGRHQQDLGPVVEAAGRSVPLLDRWHLFHELGRIRCLSGCLQDVADLVADEHLGARRFFVETTLEGRQVRAPGAAAVTEPPAWQLRRSAPRLGEHGTAVHPPPSAPVAGTATAASAAELPLAGVRVLTFSQAWSGTLGTQLLAFLGADVVQIELLHKSDVFRNTRAGVPEAIVDPGRRQHPQNVQGNYNSVNLNKRAIALDLKHPRGQELFWRLVPRFDALVENFAPNVMPQWGITLERLVEHRADIVFGSISGFGLGGPYTPYPANGSTTEPMAGLSSLHGYEGEPGMNTGGLLPDPIAAFAFASEMLAALARRDRTGRAQRVDLAMMEAVAVTVGHAIVGLDATGRTAQPMGNRHPRVAPHGMYPAADGGWIAIAAETEQSWRALAAQSGIDDPRFTTMADRKRHEDALDQLLAAWTAGRDAEAMAVELGSLGISAARVANLTEAYLRPDEHLVDRGFLQLVDHPEAGSNLMAGAPWRMSDVGRPPLRPAPCVGQHSREVLVAELEITDDEYADLVAAGVTGTL